MAATAKAKGSEKLMYPIKSMGGCTSIPGSIKSGFSPLPSAGVAGHRAKRVGKKVENLNKKNSIPHKTRMTQSDIGAGARLAARGNMEDDNDGIQDQYKR